MEEITKSVFQVNNVIIEKEETRFVFSTLWSKISDRKASYVKNGMYDYKIIRDGDKLFSVDRCNELFEENLCFIKKAIDKDDQKRNIVVTNHVPIFQHYPEEYLDSYIHEGFATDLDCFIETANIHSWIYGHHHRNEDQFKIGSTQLLTNQLGYIEYGENVGFRNNAILEL